MNLSTEKITIYHTNDIHSHFESWPQISRFLRNQRQVHENRSESCFIFDIGDHVDRSHPFTEGTNGLGNVALLNSAGFDAVTIGNNEGITMSKKTLNALYQGARFDVIVGNLFEADGNVPSWAEPYHIYTTVQGTKIGVIGATASYPVFYSQLGWEVTPPRQQLLQLAEELKEETDLIICLSHMGVNEDRLLAQQSESIDLILGAHTHHLFVQGEWVDNTLLAATGKFGDYVGEVTIELEHSSESPELHMKATVYPTEKMEHTQADIDEVSQLIEDGKQALQTNVFYNSKKLPHHLFEPSALSSFFAKAMIAYTGADCAIFNTGIFLGSLQKGWVTKQDLHTLLPHPINLCRISLTGKELQEVYELSLNQQWPSLQIRGLGFRGVYMGAMIHERVRRDGNGTLLISGSAIGLDETYTLATLDMFTFGHFFPLLQDAPKQYYMPELIRDVFGWYGNQYQ